MWPGPFEQTFVPPSHRSSIWNLTLIGPLVSEEKMFKECERQMTTDNESLPILWAHQMSLRLRWAENEVRILNRKPHKRYDLNVQMQPIMKIPRLNMLYEVIVKKFHLMCMQHFPSSKNAFVNAGCPLSWIEASFFYTFLVIIIIVTHQKVYNSANME